MLRLAGSGLNYWIWDGNDGLRILAFSDLHRDIAAAEKIVAASVEADILVGAGDFGTRGEGTLDTLEILREARKPIVLVTGNHDDSNALRDYCADWRFGHFLQGADWSYEGRIFFGLGSEIPRRNDAEWNESMSEEKAGGYLESCRSGSILVTHTPPLGTADLQKDGTHEGSEAILAAIQDKQPVLSLCGHIHFSWGKTGQIGHTPVHNLGPSVNWFEV